MKEELDGGGLDNWITQVRKGLLELYVVNALARGETYAYDLVLRLRGARGLAIPDGTVYPLLSRMKRAGLVRARLEESPSGPARKYYALTPEGRRIRRQMNVCWDEIAEQMRHLREESEDSHA